MNLFEVVATQLLTSFALQMISYAKVLILIDIAL